MQANPFKFATMHPDTKEDSLANGWQGIAGALSFARSARNYQGIDIMIASLLVGLQPTASANPTLVAGFPSRTPIRSYLPRKPRSRKPRRSEQSPKPIRQGETATATSNGKRQWQREEKDKDDGKEHRTEPGDFLARHLESLLRRFLPEEEG